MNGIPSRPGPERAVLSVVEPVSSGIGGGGFFLLHDARTGRDVFVDPRNPPGSALVVDRKKAKTP